MGEQGSADLRCRRDARLHLDVDSTVEPLFGTQQGALPGPNPRYHGRPSYHPLLAAVAETGTVIGAELRPGDTGFGDDQADFVGRCVDRLRARHKTAILCVRIDAAGDCAALMKAIAARDAYFFIKGKMDRPLCDRITLHSHWQTVDVDAHGHAVTQVAEIDFMRDSWTEAGLSVRVIARRTREHTSGRQTALWDGLDWTTQVFLTNDPFIDPADVPFEYNGRAGIEPLIAELKQAWALGKNPERDLRGQSRHVSAQAARAQSASAFRAPDPSAVSANVACELDSPRPTLHPRPSRAQRQEMEPAAPARFASAPPHRLNTSASCPAGGKGEVCPRTGNSHAIPSTRLPARAQPPDPRRVRNPR